MVFHVVAVFDLADLNQTPQFFANGNRLLIADDDAGVVSSRPQEFGVKPAEIRGIVCVERATLLGGPRQLFLVRKAEKRTLATRGHVPSSVTQPVQQSMSIGILIKVNFERAQRGVGGFRS